jgi:hypothetical protein
MKTQLLVAALGLTGAFQPAFAHAAEGLNDGKIKHGS